jgi:PAS domain-containing protein
MLETLSAQWFHFIESEYLVTGPALAMGLFLMGFSLFGLVVQYLTLRRENRIFQMELGLNTRIDETNYELHERLLRLDGQIRNLDKEIDPSLSLFEQCREAMVMLCDDRILDMNQAAIDLFGFETREMGLAGRPDELFDGDDSTDTYRFSMNTAEQTGCARFTGTLRRAGGAVINADTVVSLIRRCDRRVLLLSIRPTPPIGEKEYQDSLRPGR